MSSSSSSSTTSRSSKRLRHQQAPDQQPPEVSETEEITKLRRSLQALSVKGRFENSELGLTAREKYGLGRTFVKRYALDPRALIEYIIEGEKREPLPDFTPNDEWADFFAGDEAAEGYAAAEAGLDVRTKFELVLNYCARAIEYCSNVAHSSLRYPKLSERLLHFLAHCWETV